MTTRNILWQPWDGPGLEHLQLRLMPIVADGGVYRYEGLFRNFTADLPVDRDGVVLSYPSLFRRVTIMP